MPRPGILTQTAICSRCGARSKLDKEDLEISRADTGLSMKLHGCVNTVPAPGRPGGTATVDRCGSGLIWDVASGRRMGGVFDEDATEVAPPRPRRARRTARRKTRSRGQAVVLGFPSPVPAASRLTLRF